MVFFKIPMSSDPELNNNKIIILLVSLSQLAFSVWHLCCLLTVDTAIGCIVRFKEESASFE